MNSESLKKEPNKFEKGDGLKSVGISSFLYSFVQVLQFKIYFEVWRQEKLCEEQKIIRNTSNDRIIGVMSLSWLA